MLVANTSMPTVDPSVVLLVMMTLLAMMLLMRLVLILVTHAHLHISLVARSPIHHDMLALLMALIEHTVRIVGGGLRDWRA